MGWLLVVMGWLLVDDTWFLMAIADVDGALSILASRLVLVTNWGLVVIYDRVTRRLC
jgi:hypothetical protein